MRSIAFFNNKGGVGKTTLGYHLSWMFAELGYSVVAAAGRPVQAYLKWLRRIPEVYRVEALGETNVGTVAAAEDLHCLATLKHYRSLMPMAQEARKPIFHLKAADGALGGHIHAVQDCHDDFTRLAFAIADRCGVSP